MLASFASWCRIRDTGQAIKPSLRGVDKMKVTTQKKRFVFDGLVGYVFSDGFISWDTINCHIDSLKNSPLKTAALQAK